MPSTRYNLFLTRLKWQGSENRLMKLSESSRLLMFWHYKKRWNADVCISGACILNVNIQFDHISLIVGNENLDALDWWPGGTTNIKHQCLTTWQWDSTIIYTFNCVTRLHNVIFMSSISFNIFIINQVTMFSQIWYINPV